MLPAWDTDNTYVLVRRGQSYRADPPARTFEDVGESADVCEGRAAAPGVAHVHEPWVEGLDVLLFVRDEAMLHEGATREEQQQVDDYCM